MMTDFLGKKGIRIDIGENYLGDFVKARGFVDISVDFAKLPNGTWPEGVSSQRFQLRSRSQSKGGWSLQQTSLWERDRFF
jgi:hypothetical protein